MEAALEKKAFWGSFSEAAIVLCEIHQMEPNEENINIFTSLNWNFGFLKGYYSFDEEGNLQLSTNLNDC